MAYDFPASPGVGQEFTSGSVVYVFNGTGWTIKGGSTNSFVLKTGDTMSGNLTIATTGGNPNLILNRVSVGNADLVGSLNGLNRWTVRLGDANAESGGNVGSQFAVYRWNDAGVFIDAPLLILRSTGAAYFNATVPSTSYTTGALTVVGGVGVGGTIRTAGDIYSEHANPGLFLNKNASGEGAYIYSMKAGLLRWRFDFGNVTTESGSATGSDIIIHRFANDGSTYLGQALSILRDTGNVSFGIDVPASHAVYGSTHRILNVTSTPIAGNSLALLELSGNGGGGATSGPIGQISFSNQAIAVADKRIAVIAADLDGANNTGQVSINVWSAGVYATKFIVRASGQVQLPSNIASTSATTGTLVVTGGVGIGGAIRIGGPVAGNAVIGVGYTTDNYGHGGISLNNSLISATVAYLQTFFRNGVFVGAISSTDTATTFSTTSDERLKEDLKSFDGGKIIDEIEVHDFKWKSSQRRDIGVIAQRVVDVYPQAVAHINDTWGVDYSKFVPLLLQEMKSVRVRLQQLEEK